MIKGCRNNKALSRKEPYGARVAFMSYENCSVGSHMECLYFYDPYIRNL
jgi:hypothetical protein